MKKILTLIICFISFFSMLNAQGQLKAEYYNGTNFEEYVGANTVSNIDFYWDHESPMKGLNQHECSVIYTGQIKTPVSGEITFSARVDDGIRVYIDDRLIISNWQLNDVGISEGKIYLDAGKNYNITVKYFNAIYEAELKLFWKLPEDPNRTWYNKLWYGDDPVIISPEHFSAPVDKKAKKVDRA